MTRNVAATMLLVMTLAAAVHAQDRPGSSDHALLSRYPGSTIIGYRQADFDEYRFVTGATSGSRRAKPAFETFSGKATTLIYRIKGEQSVVQVFRNYEQALRQAGATVKISCVNNECPDGVPVDLYRGTNREALYRSMRFDGVHGGNGEVRYLSALGTYNGVPVAINLLVNRFGHGDQTDVGLDIVEMQAMKSGLVTVTADSLQRDIADKGRAVLDGIYFDTDKDTLQPESAAALKAIAHYLQQNPSRRFLVVGHTDMAGDYAHNMDLSSRRAGAVVVALVQQYSIDRARLKPAGVGPASPVATNASDHGRAQNRRVELVATSS